jgi:hypothetical protein
VFEAHHPNYSRARKVIQKYQVETAPPPCQPSAAAAPDRLRHGTDQVPTELLGDEAFYSVLRRRVYSHLVSVGHPDGGPTARCKALFWVSFAAWAAAWWWTWWCGSVGCAVLVGLTASWVGAFGHNWVHQPRYKQWAYLSLDLIGANMRL